jgi:hypothetical protein
VRTTTSPDEVIRLGSDNATARNVVYVFQLPTLAAGESFADATFSFTLLQNGATQVSGANFASSGTPAFSLDLYGLGRRASAAVAAGDVYFGATPDATDATLLLQSFITSTTSVGTVNFSAPTLATYLNEQYASGAGAGGYVFLRLNPNGAAGSGNTEPGYRVSMAENTGTTSYSKIAPVIDYAVVPEPGTAFMAIMGGAGLLLLRRRS